MMILGSKTLYDPVEVSNILKGYVTLSLTIDLYNNPETLSFIKRWRKQKSTNGRVDPISKIYICDNATDDDGRFYLYQGVDSSTLTDSMDSTLPKYKNQLKCAGLNFSSFKLDGSDIARDAFFAYDSTITVAKGLHHLLYLSSLKDTITTQKQITYDILLNSIINNVEFDGVTGHIHYPADKPDGYQGRGDRVTDALYQVLNFNPTMFLSMINSQAVLTGNEGMNIVGTVHSETGFTLCSEPSNPFYHITSCPEIIYNTIDNQPPIDRPPLTIVEVSIALKVVTLVSIHFIFYIFVCFYPFIIILFFL